MNEPHDFGLSPLGTLAHVGTARPARGHGPFWQHWHERVWSFTPRLRPWDPAADPDADPGAGGVTHVFESVGSVRIGCRLIEPTGEGTPLGGVVQLHGAGGQNDLDDRTPLSASGCLVMKVRVRGYPGSRFDTPALNASDSWITHGLAEEADWVLPESVADVVNAFRALRDRLPEEAPISIAGESLGGGLAVIAGAQLTGRLRVHRLAIGLPSLGDWMWRLAQSEKGDPSAGLGAEVADLVRRRPEARERIAQRLRLCDAAVHARRLVCPTLCKLALRDEVVPAPAAASVFNAIGASPTMKWRFVVDYGHFDGGVSDLRRHALFERLAARFLGPRVDLMALMARWSETLRSGDRAPDETDQETGAGA